MNDSLDAVKIQVESSSP